MFLFFLSLLCCAFTLLEHPSARWPCTAPALSTQEHLAALAWAAGWFFLSQTPTTSLSTGCNFLLVSLISSPNVLAADSDPGSSFSFHVIHHPCGGGFVQPQLSQPSLPLLPRAAGLPAPAQPQTHPAQAQLWVSPCRNPLVCTQGSSASSLL